MCCGVSYFILHIKCDKESLCIHFSSNTCNVFYLLSSIYELHWTGLLLLLLLTMSQQCWDGGPFLIFRMSKSILFFVNWISFSFSFSYEVLPFYDYYYCIWIRYWYALLFYTISLPRNQSRDVTPRLGEGGWFFIFDCSSPFFLFIEFNYVFYLLYSANMLCLLLLYLIRF